MIPLDNDNKSVLVDISYGIRLTNYRVMCPLHGIYAQKSIREECNSEFFCLWIFCAQICTTASGNPVKVQTQVLFGGSTG